MLTPNGPDHGDSTTTPNPEARGLPQVIASCPVCRCTTALQLRHVTAQEATQHSVRKEAFPERFAKMHAEICHLWEGTSCQILRCQECSFTYAFPYVSGREGFYGLLLSSPSYPQDRFEFGRVVAILRDRFQGRPDAHLLEVGAGDGAFVRQVAPALIPAAQVLCTEFSAAGAQAIRDRGIACEMTDVRKLREPRQQHRFAALCMFQVLEHLDRLDELWEAFNFLAAPSADLFLSVPNDRWIHFQETHGGELDMPPNHIGRWNQTAFATIAKSHGWELVKHFVEPASRRGVVRRIATSRFFHARQTPGSLTDRTTRIANRKLRRVSSLPMLAMHYLAALPLAFSVDPTGLGDTQLAYLRKIA